jgi:hypothetical protein
MATLTWLSGSSGDWTDAADWSTSSVPGTKDTAVIGIGTVVLSKALSVSGLIEAGSAAGASMLAGSGSLLVKGPASFSGNVAQNGLGSIELQGASTLAAAADGSATTLALSGGWTLKNSATLTLASGQVLLGGDPTGSGDAAGVLDNDAKGVIDITATGTVIEALSSSAYVVNDNALVSAPGSGDVVIDAALENAGTLQVESGTLNLAAGGWTHASYVSVAAGATLAFTGGSFTMLSGSYNVAGETDIVGATLDLTGVLLQNTSRLSVVDGTLLLSRTATVGALNQGSGTGGASAIFAANIIDNGAATFSGVAVQSGRGGTTLANGGTIDSAAGEGLFLDGGHKLFNDGLLLLAGGGIWLGENPLGTTLGGAKLVNPLIGTIDIASDGVAIGAGSGTLKMQNLGTIEKTAGSGLSDIQISVANAGALLVQSGTLSLDAGGRSLIRRIGISDGASLDINGGTFTVTSGTFDVAGGLIVSGGELDLSHTLLLEVADGTVISGGTLQLGIRKAVLSTLAQGGTDPAGSVLMGTTTVYVQGNAIFTGVAEDEGRGTTNLNANATLDAPGQDGTSGVANGLYLDGYRNLENNGTFVDAGGAIWLGISPVGTSEGDATFTNAGTFDIHTDGTIVAGSATGYTDIASSGAILRSAGTGTATIAVPLINTGSVEVASGTLDFTAMVGQGSFFIDAGCVLEFGAVVDNATMSFTGSGAVLQLDAPVDFDGSVANLGSGDAIDLTGLAFGSGPTLGYAGTSQGGTLTVTDGGTSLALSFIGDYTTHVFQAVADADGGTKIF